MKRYGALTLHWGATARLAAVNLLVFLVAWCLGDNVSVLELPADPSALLRRPWALVTYMFTHQSFWHLLVNMLWLWMFGRLLQYVSGNGRVVAVYLVGGLAGGLLYMACASCGLPVNPLLTGASASVIALMTAVGVTAPNMPVNLFLIGRVKLKWVVLAGVLLLFLRMGGGGFAAHIGGAAAGLSVIWWRRFASISDRVRNMRRRRRDAAKGKKLRRAIENRRRDMNRLDSLLDRVRLSGFDSLSDSEQKELRTLSDRLSATSEKKDPK